MWKWLCWSGAPIALLLTFDLDRTAAQMQAPEPVASDSFLALVPSREVDEIQRALAATDLEQAMASKAEKRAVGLRQGAEARIEAKKRDISNAENRKNAAKREKREGETAALEAEKKALEREKDLLEQRKSLRDVEIDLGKKQAEVAGLRRRALDLERQLMLKRAEQVGTGRSGPQGTRTDQIVFDLEKATLEAQRELAGKEGGVVDQEKRLVEHRLKILEAQRKVMSGR